jgi:hypothetical protein
MEKTPKKLSQDGLSPVELGTCSIKSRSADHSTITFARLDIYENEVILAMFDARRFTRTNFTKVKHSDKQAEMTNAL